MQKIFDFFNFENVGGKIKTLTKWTCWITILIIWIATPIAFIWMVSDSHTAEYWWIPLVAAIVSPFVVWIVSWSGYAVGEYVELVHVMRDKEVDAVSVKTEAAGIKVADGNNVNTAAEEQATANVQRFICPKCSGVVKYGEKKCSTCGQKFNWPKRK